MVKNIKDLSKLFDINNNKKDFDKDIDNILNVLNKDFYFEFKKEDILIKNNIVKIKTNSNNKFVLFLNLYKINEKLNSLENKFILEL